MTEEEIRFCPNCGSTDVEPDTSNAAYMGLAGGNANDWSCNSCGFTGFMPTGDPDEDFDEELTEKVGFEPDEEYPREDTGFGKAYLKYVLYVALPFLLLYLWLVFL